MPDRAARAAEFLAATDWAGATHTPLAGDASARRYGRLTHAGQSAILMDAPPETNTNTHAYIRMTGFLRSLALSAPEILAEDRENGFLILEDFGETLFAGLMDGAPEKERQLYFAATDVLLFLHRQTPPGFLSHYSPAKMARFISPVFEFYAATAEAPVSLGEQNRIYAELETVLTRFNTISPAITLRDFHAENLIWLPARDNLRRVGLLDFQDALTCHPAYDLVSLLGDARRAVSPEIQHAVLSRYLSGSGLERHDFLAAYAACGAQRNLRIIGIFARLSLVMDKPRYVALIPAVWTQLTQYLSHPGLQSLKHMLAAALPVPDAPVLEKLGGNR